MSSVLNQFQSSLTRVFLKKPPALPGPDLTATSKSDSGRNEHSDRFEACIHYTKEMKPL
jgi:hypothetical protein